MVKYYHGNESGGTPGILPQPYYWWEAGAMFGSLIDYWYYTGDTTYNNITTQAMLFQVGTNDNYEPSNQTLDLGNDDQCFWGIAAMSAAESNYTNPDDTDPQWLALAQAVFNTQAAVWDNSTCGGGLRWQKFPFNAGFDYKNAISNGCFFNLAARLGAYTGNSSYLTWAERAFEWSHAIGLVADNNAGGLSVYDGTDDEQNCTSVNHLQWTYNAGTYLYGCAMMWNQTGDDMWKEFALELWNGSSVFFTGTNNQVMYEVACEPQANCNTDQLSFKAYLARWMAASVKVAPFLTDMIMPYLQTSAAAAAAQCDGGSDGVTCGTKWTQTVWDGTYGVGQQMSALEVIQSLLIADVRGPLTNNTGGSSKGNAGAGGNSLGGVAALLGNTIATKKITTADRAGAGIVTVIVLGTFLGGAWYVLLPEESICSTDMITGG